MKANIKNFVTWLRKQRTRNDSVGDFARDFTEDWDSGCAQTVNTISSLDRHLRDEHDASDAVLLARDRAWREFAAPVSLAVQSKREGWQRPRDANDMRPGDLIKLTVKTTGSWKGLALVISVSGGVVCGQKLDRDSTVHACLYQVMVRKRIYSKGEAARLLATAKDNAFIEAMTPSPEKLAVDNQNAHLYSLFCTNVDEVLVVDGREIEPVERTVKARVAGLEPRKPRSLTN